MTGVLINMDGCPVVDGAVRLCGRFGVECLTLYDTSHHFEEMGVRALAVSKGADSVDFALVNLLRPGDIVVTQDYGLAAMCIARGARILNQDGMEYMAQNVDTFLPAHHTARKIHNVGGRPKGPCEHLPEQNQMFCGKLACLLGEGWPCGCFLPSISTIQQNNVF